MKLPARNERGPYPPEVEYQSRRAAKHGDGVPGVTVMVSGADILPVACGSAACPYASVWFIYPPWERTSDEPGESEHSCSEERHRHC